MSPGFIFRKLPYEPHILIIHLLTNSAVNDNIFLWGYNQCGRWQCNTYSVLIRFKGSFWSTVVCHRQGLIGQIIIHIGPQCTERKDASFALCLYIICWPFFFFFLWHPAVTPTASYWTHGSNQSPPAVRKSMFNLPHSADTFQKNNCFTSPSCNRNISIFQIHVRNFLESIVNKFNWN